MLSIGAGYQADEFARFGQDLPQALPRQLKIMIMLEQAFAEEACSHQGRFSR